MRVLLTNNEAQELQLCDIGLGYLAGSLLADGHEAELMLKARNLHEMDQIMDRFQPQLVGIKVLASGVGKTIETVQRIRRRQGCPVVIGGPHVTGDPGGILEYIPADYAVQGPGERSLSRLAGILEHGGAATALDETPGLIRRLPGAGFRVNPPDLIPSLDDLPLPAWHLMPPAEHESLVVKHPPAASVVITRGCTHRCAYCAEGGTRFQKRSLEHVLAEIELLITRFGVREIQFLDSNFLFSKSYIMEFCRQVGRRGWNIAFAAPNGMRLDQLDEELAAALAGIGFYRANLGIESGSPEILQSVNKKTHPDVFRQKVPLLARHGIWTVGNFMLGFPGETRAQMLMTRNLALELPLTGANFAIYTPMPGTPMYERLTREGHLKDDHSYRNYNFVAYENNLTELSPDALHRFRNHCIMRFLLRPRTMRTVVSLLSDPAMRHSLLRRVYGMYGQKYLWALKQRIPGLGNRRS